MRCQAVAVALLACLPSSCFLVPPIIASSAADLPESTPIGTPAVVHGGLALGVARSDESWAPADRLPYVAMDADRQLSDLPIWMSSFFAVGYSDEVPESSPRGSGTTTTVDFALGLRHYRALGPLEPFVGAGLALVDRRFTYTDAEPGNLYDYSTGFYFEAGFDVAIVENFAIGLMARQYIGSDQSIAEQTFDADYTTFLVMFAYRR